MSDPPDIFFDNTALRQCIGVRERPEGPSFLEATAAELWVREKYRKYFLERPDPKLVTWQLERFWTAYDTGDPVIDTVMDVLESDYKNLYPASVIKKFNKLLASGAPEPLLREIIREAGEGGARKPDMLGVCLQRDMCVFDAVEVGTVKTAKSTYDELHEKLGIIRLLSPHMRLKVEAMAQRSMRRHYLVSVPTTYRATPSAFRLARDEWIMPMPVRISREGRDVIVDWICFHPSKDWHPTKPAPGELLPGAEDRPGTDGLFLYHVHQARLPRLPDEVRRHVERQLQDWRRKEGLVLELNPAFAASARSSESDWSPEARLLFGYGSAAVLMIAFVTIAWEVGLVAEGTLLARQGLVALSGAPAALRGAVQATLQLSERMGEAAIRLQQFIPRLAPAF